MQDRTDGLTYDEALRRLYQGAAIRRPRWNDESRMELRDGVPVMNLGGRITHCTPREHETWATDWQAISK